MRPETLIAALVALSSGVQAASCPTWTTGLLDGLTGSLSADNFVETTAFCMDNRSVSGFIDVELNLLTIPDDDLPADHFVVELNAWKNRTFGSDKSNGGTSLDVERSSGFNFGGGDGVTWEQAKKCRRELLRSFAWKKLCKVILRGPVPF